MEFVSTNSKLIRVCCLSCLDTKWAQTSSFTGRYILTTEIRVRKALKGVDGTSKMSEMKLCS